jgi:Flp pilus assembly protein TadG
MSNSENPVRKSSPSPLSRFTTRFIRAKRGATAVEFALVSAPMLVMIFGLLELALVFLVNTTLDAAMQSAARQIRTGEFQTGGANTPTNFKALVCSKMTWLSPKCAANLWLDVRTYSDFASLVATPATNPSTFDPTKVCFSPGQPTDIVLVRAYFAWNLFTPLLNNALENMGGGSGKRMISSTTAFRNEPYNNNLPQGAAVCP